MKKISFLIVLIFTSLSVFGQQELTLEDAVMKQYRDFYPQNIFGFNWVPNSSAQYSFISGYTTLVLSDVNKKKEDDTILLDIETLNKKAGTTFRYFSGFSWLSNHEFTVSDGETFVVYDTQKQQASSWKIKGDNALMNWKNKAIAYTIDNNVYVQYNGEDVAITHHTDKNIVSGQTISRSEFGISGGLFWAENGNYLAFYTKDETNVHDYPLLNVDTIPGELMSIKYPMAGQKSEQVSVGVYNLKTKKTVYIKPHSGLESYLTNLTFSKDGKYVVIAELNRGQNHLWLDLYDAETGDKIRTLFEETNDKWVEPEHPAFFLNNQNDFVWMSERDGYQNLYLYNIKGQLIRQLTKNQFPIKEIIDASAKGDVIYFTATGPEAINTLVYSVTTKGKQSLLTSKEGTHSVKVSADGNYVFDQYSTMTIPNIASILSIKGKEVKRLLTAENKLADYKIGKTIVQKIPVNGIEEYARIIYPSDFDSTKKYPVLVYVYGGPHAQLITNSWYAGSSLWMNWMAEQGYIIFTVDSRGSENRGFEFESVIHRELGKHEMEDQIAALDWLKKKSYIDADRIAVHGWSFGGFMTTNLLLTYPDVFTTGVAGGPVTKWNLYEIMYGERYMDRPEENPEGYKATDLPSKVKNLKGKLLLIHGSVDDVVLLQHNYLLLKAFIEAEKQVDYFVYPMHKHNVMGKDRVHLMRKVLTYILENNR